MKIAIIGSALAGGAVQIVDVLLEHMIYSDISIYDDDFSAQGAHILGFPVVGTIERVGLDFADSKIDCAIIAVGSVEPRRSLFEKLRKIGIPFPNIVSGRSVISKSAIMGSGNVVLPMVYLGPNTSIGDNNYFTTSTTINHDTIVGSHCYFSTGVSIAGRAQIGDAVRLDTACSVTADAVVPSCALIGPGESFGPSRGR